MRFKGVYRHTNGRTSDTIPHKSDKESSNINTLAIYCTEQATFKFLISPYKYQNCKNSLKVSRCYQSESNNSDAMLPSTRNRFKSGPSWFKWPSMRGISLYSTHHHLQLEFPPLRFLQVFRILFYLSFLFPERIFVFWNLFWSGTSLLF